MESNEDLRKRILELSKEYTWRVHAPKSFKPGDKIQYAGRVFGPEEVANLVDASLDSYLTLGKYGKQFEEKFRNYTGLRSTVLANSGSSANLLALSALTSQRLGDARLRSGQEVITCATGFPTTVNPIIQNGLVPAFVDVELGTYNANISQLEQMINKNTGAIMLAHTLGNPFDLDKVMGLAKKHNLYIMEDCCDALGSKYGGQMVGTFGDLMTVSFYPAHQITMGEGGLVGTNKPVLAKIVESFRDWGRSCFPSGTLINVEETLKPIEEVRIGDQVLTHEGRFETVSELFTRNFTGKLFTIKARMRPEISVTEDHPFLVQRWKKGKRREWVLARDLKQGDILIESIGVPDKYVLCPKKHMTFRYDTLYGEKEETLELIPDLMRLIGYWLAEGSLAKGKKGRSGYAENKYFFYRVDFAFHEKEKFYVRDVLKLMKKIFGVKGHVRTRKNSKAVSVCFKTRKGYEFFEQFFGRGAVNKKIPGWMIYCPKRILNGLITGFWRGDGSSSFQGFVMNSCSKQLIEQMRRILLRFGILCSNWRKKIDAHTVSIVNGLSIVAKHDLHSLSLYGLNAEKFGHIVGAKYRSRSLHELAFLSKDGKYACYPVCDIVSEDVEELQVFNLEVEKDHSYHAGGLAVHNCWCEPGKSNTCGKRFAHQLGELPFGYDHKFTYDHIGYNLKPNDFSPAFGAAQMDRLPGFIESRKRNFGTYYTGLKYLDAERFLLLPKWDEKADPAWFGFPITVKEDAPFTRNELTQYLEQNGIETRNIFAGNITRQPAYQGVPQVRVPSLVNSDLVMNNGFFIGVYPGITPDRAEYVVDTFKRFMEDKPKISLGPY